MSRGLRLLERLLLDYAEIDGKQKIDDADFGVDRMASAHECGWIGDHIGPVVNYGWRIKDNGSGALLIDTADASGVGLRASKTHPSSIHMLGIDPLGRVLDQRTDDTTPVLMDDADAWIQVPNDAVWRTLVARWHTTQREPGTLTLTGGSPTIVGVGTEFTRLNQASDPGLPTKIRIDATDTTAGNEGTYIVDTITDDTHMTLATAVPETESEVFYRVMGRFRGSVPTADPDARANRRVAWELVTRTTTRPADGLIAYDVMRTGGVTYLVDRRHASLYQPVTRPMAAAALVPSFRLSAAGSPTSQVHSFIVGGVNDSYGIGLALAPARTGGHTAGLAEDRPTGMLLGVLFQEGGGGLCYARVWTHTPIEGNSSSFGWGTPDGGAVVTVYSGAGIKDIAVVDLPLAGASPATHWLFVVNSSGDVVGKTTPDDGATWSSSSNVITGIGAERVAAVRTRLGRIVLVISCTASPYLRYVYSDDLGTTWQTNSGAGFNMGGGATADITDVAAVEDGRGNFWTVTAEGSGYVDNPWRLYHGQAEGDPTVDANEQTAGWFVGPDSTTNEQASTVDMIRTPDGLVAVVGDVLDSGTSQGDLIVSHLARRDPVRLAYLVAASDGGTGNVTPTAAGANASGDVFVAWFTGQDAGAMVSVKIARLTLAAAAANPLGW